MYKISNLAKTIAQFKILNHLDTCYPSLVDNLKLVELVSKNEVKIKDQSESVYISYDEKESEITILDEKKVFCRKERV